MSAALQIYYQPFDVRFFKLPPEIQSRIEAKIDAMGLCLDRFPHHHLTGRNRYRLRAGDYRVIYTFDVSRNTIHLLERRFPIGLGVRGLCASEAGFQPVVNGLGSGEL